jgi:hypothetical protein
LCNQGIQNVLKKDRETVEKLDQKILEHKPGFTNSKPDSAHGHEGNLTNTNPLYFPCTTGLTKFSMSYSYTPRLRFILFVTVSLGFWDGRAGAGGLSLSQLKLSGVHM